MESARVRLPPATFPRPSSSTTRPSTQVLSKGNVKAGSFYFDYADDRIYLADDPKGRKVEATVAAFAFESLASNVLIENLIIEKYANPAQKGQSIAGAVGWTVKNSEIRLNSGAGIHVGNGASVSAAIFITMARAASQAKATISGSRTIGSRPTISTASILHGRPEA